MIKIKSVNREDQSVEVLTVSVYKGICSERGSRELELNHNNRCGLILTIPSREAAQAIITELKRAYKI